jgi:O-6-methylguanine DNA methyltransferase
VTVVWTGGLAAGLQLPAHVVCFTCWHQSVGVNAMQRVDAAEVCAPIETPIGRMWVAGSGTTVSAVGRAAAAVEASVWSRLGRPVQRIDALPEPLASAVAAQLRVAGREHGSDEDAAALGFDLAGLPEPERAVLLAVLAIPRGEVRTYGQIARQIGQPKRAKDVGLALNQNPIPLLIPCHRVVRTDGTIGGYRFGARAKQTLLRSEGVPLTDEAQLALDFQVA